MRRWVLRDNGVTCKTENCSTFLYPSRPFNHSLWCSQKSRSAGFADKDFIILIVWCAFHSLLSGLSIKRRFKTTDSSFPEEIPNTDPNRQIEGPTAKDADLRYGASPFHLFVLSVPSFKQRLQKPGPNQYNGRERGPPKISKFSGHEAGSRVLLPVSSVPI